MTNIVPFRAGKTREPAYTVENGRCIITFPAAPVWALVAHAKAAATFEFSGDVVEREPVLHLIATNNLSVYLVSPGPPGHGLQVHANGFHPQDRGWLKNKISVYGPDEELAELKVQSVQNGLSPAWKTFEIGISDENIVVLARRGRWTNVRPCRACARRVSSPSGPRSAPAA